MPRPLLFALAPLLCAFSLAARAAGPLTVEAFIPQGEVDALAQVSARFSEPMRPLGATEEDPAAAPLQLETPGAALPPGSFRWLDPQTLAYVFDRPVDFPLIIKARVPSDARALSGATPPGPLEFAVNTPALALTVKKGVLRPKETGFSILANYELDIRSLSERTSLNLNGRPAPLDFEQPEPGARSPGGQKQWEYKVTAGAELLPDVAAVLTLAPGIRALGGGVPAPELVQTLPAYGRLAVLEWRPQAAAKGGPVVPEDKLGLLFSNPVRFRDLAEHVSVSPEAPLPSPPPAGAGPGGESVSQYLPYGWQPRTRYTVTVRPGLTDVYDTALETEESVTFETGDYAPGFGMAGGRVVLERSLGGGLPFWARNVDTVHVTLRHLPLENGAFLPLLDDKAPARIPGLTERRLTLDFTGERNKAIRHVLDLPKIFGLSSVNDLRGMVRVEAVPGAAGGKAAAPDAGTTHTVLAQVTNLGLYAGLGRESGLAWVTDLATGLAPAGKERAALRLLDHKGKTLWVGMADAQGLATLPGTDVLTGGPAWLQARLGRDIAVLDLARFPLRPAPSGFPPKEEQQRNWRVHAVTQLPVYGAGQTVRYAAFAASLGADAAGEYAPCWSLLADRDLTLEFRDARGRAVHTRTARTDGYGAVSGEFTLDAGADQGWYHVLARCAGMDASVRSRAFRVASFRPPDFAVNITAPASRPVAGQGPGAQEEAPLTASLSASFFSGASLGGVKAALKVATSPARVSPRSLAGYRTGIEPDPPFRPCPYARTGGQRDPAAELSAVLDRDGKAEFALPAVPVKPGEPRTVSLEATITDVAGLAGQGTASFLLHPSAVYVGVKAPRFAPVAREVSLDLKAASWDDGMLAGVRVHLTAERIIREDKEERAEQTWEREVFLENELGEKVRVRFEEPGCYRLTASVMDGRGRENLTRFFVFAHGRGVAWGGTDRGGGLNLMPEKEGPYASGETARILLNNPLGKALALVTLERGGVLERRIQPVEGGPVVLEIPLTKRHGPYVYAAVTLVSGGPGPPGETWPGLVPGGLAPDPLATPDATAPRTMRGAVLLTVEEPEQTGLVAEARTDRTEYRPGGEVRAEVRVTDRKGAPVKARVVLLAVDDSMLRASGEALRYNPSMTFPAVTPSGVTGFDLRASLMAPLAGRLGAIRRPVHGNAGPWDSGADAFPDTPAVQYTDKTNSRTLGAGAGIPLPAEFNPMAFWLAQGETDDAGGLNISFTLPETLTSYRLAAVAVDAKARFAEARAGFAVNKPLQLLPALPRFGVEGDRLEARVLVRNLGREPGTVVVRADAQGMDLLQREATLTLNPGESGLAAFPARLGPPGQARFGATGVMGAETDGLEVTVPVRPAVPLTTVAAAGVLSQGESFTLPVSLPAQLDSRSKLQVVMAPSPASALPLAVRDLLEYPWECLEQRLSKAWTRVLRMSQGHPPGLAPEQDDKQAVQTALASADTFQRPDGGFAPWPGMRTSHYYLTAYALLVNSEAKRLGCSLKPDTEKRAYAYLRQTLTGRQESAGPGRAGRSPESDALALWVLMRKDKDRPGMEVFKTVYDAVLADASPSPLALAGLMLAAREVPELAAKLDVMNTLMHRLEQRAVVTPTERYFSRRDQGGYWMTMGSSLRDNAVLLAALARARPAYKGLTPLALWVCRGLGEKSVISTQEAAYGIWAIAAYLEFLGGGGPVEIRAYWNNREVETKRFDTLLDPARTWTVPASGLSRDRGRETGEERDGSDRLTLLAVRGKPYWTARLSFASPSLPLRPENAGFTVSRRWKTKGPWALGQVVEVEVILVTPSTRRHVLLFDPFPAGLEPLRATRADPAEAEQGLQPPWEWREAVLDGMLLYAGAMPPGVYRYTYALRAVTPGVFVQRPGTVEEMYAPEVYGRTGPDTVTVER